MQYLSNSCALQEKRERVGLGCAPEQTRELKAGCGKSVFILFYKIDMFYIIYIT